MHSFPQAVFDEKNISRVYPWRGRRHSGAAWSDFWAVSVSTHGTCGSGLLQTVLPSMTWWYSLNSVSWFCLIEIFVSDGYWVLCFKKIILWEMGRRTCAPQSGSSLADSSTLSLSIRLLSFSLPLYLRQSTCSAPLLQMYKAFLSHFTSWNYYFLEGNLLVHIFVTRLFFSSDLFQFFPLPFFNQT